MPAARGEYWFWLALAAIAATLGSIQILTVRQESQTWDEGFEIVAGYQYLTTGVYRASLENPPLERILEALPLLFLRPDLKGEALGADNTGPDDVQAGLAFLYKNRLPADRILFAARLPMIAVTVGLLLALAAWCRRKFGAAAGIVAALLFALDPTVIAHGALVKNDMTVTAMAFLAVIAWDWYLETGKGVALCAAGIALGLALGSKYSALFLLPVFLILYLLRECLLRDRRRFSWPRFLRSFAVIGLLAAAVILILYAPYDGALLPHRRSAPGTPLREVLDQSTMLGRRIAWIGSRLGWRSHPYLVGLATFAGHGGGTHPAYIWGNRGATGWWYYFPFAFAVKTPVAVLLAIVLAVPFAATQPLLTIPILTYAALSMNGHVDIGLRHLLPVYPFLYAAAAAGLVNLRWRFRTPLVIVILAAILAGAALESFAVYPYYLAFFNVLAGGPRNGPRYLVDSNIDWGQDLKRLGEFSSAHGDTPKGQAQICVMYFGTAPTWYYLRYAANFPTLQEMSQGAPLECQFAAVSVTPLEGVYVPPDWFAWLRSVPPLARIGYSIYVWDVHGPAFQRAYATLSSAGGALH
jgi:Dolichyl-phosphate-mannose-protein mannosyltransferase